MFKFFFWSFEMKKWHYDKKEHSFESKNHYHLYIFDNSYPNHDKTRNPPITFFGEHTSKSFVRTAFFTLTSFFLGQNNPI